MASRLSSAVSSPWPTSKTRLTLATEFRIAASGMAWKGEESERMVALASGDIKWAQWMRVARGYQLRVGLRDRTRETFDGFSREVGALSDRLVLFQR